MYQINTYIGLYFLLWCFEDGENVFTLYKLFFTKIDNFKLLSLFSLKNNYFFEILTFDIGSEIC